MPLEIGSNNLKTPATVIDKIMDYLAVCPLTLQSIEVIVLADNMRSAINMAWEHGGADFQSRFDKSTAQPKQIKEGALRVL